MLTMPNKPIKTIADVDLWPECPACGAPMNECFAAADDCYYFDDELASEYGFDRSIPGQPSSAWKQFWYIEGYSQYRCVKCQYISPVRRVRSYSDGTDDPGYHPALKPLSEDDYLRLNIRQLKQSGQLTLPGFDHLVEVHTRTDIDQLDHETIRAFFNMIKAATRKLNEDGQL